MPENCHWTEVGRLYLFIHVRVVLIRMVAKRVAPVPNRLII